MHLLKQARPDLADCRRRGRAVSRPCLRITRDISAILPPRASALRTFAPVLCLNLHGGTRSARLTLLSGARFRAGFEIFRPGWIYNTPIPTAQETLGIARRVHTAEHLASAMFYLGVPITEVPRARSNRPPGRSQYAPSAPYAVIHPTGCNAGEDVAVPNLFWNWRAISNGRWGWNQFSSAARATIFPVFAVSHRGRTRRWVRSRRLMRDAAFFAGNDSGPAHVAAAFGVPQVVIFGPSDAEVWAPWRTPAEMLKADGAIENITVERAMQARGPSDSRCEA